MQCDKGQLPAENDRHGVHCALYKGPNGNGKLQIHLIKNLFICLSRYLIGSFKIDDLPYRPWRLTMNRAKDK